MKQGARRLGLLACATALAVGASSASLSLAQRVTPGRPLTLVVGGSGASGGTATEKLDARRSNRSRAALPSGSLRVVWSRQLRPLPHPPLVTEDGVVVAVTDQGDAVFLNPDGTDLGHVLIGPGPMSAPTFLADGTLVVTNGMGEVIGVRRQEVVFRTHAVEPIAAAADGIAQSGGTVHVTIRQHGRTRTRIPQPRGPEAPTRSSLLPLDDGGVAVAFDRELLALDATGIVRSRAIAPASIASPLVAMAQSVAFVGDGGEVYDWDLMSGEGAVRGRGTFGGGVDGAVAALDGRRLMAVVRGARLVVLDLPTGIAETRATTIGIFTGGLSLGVPHGPTEAEAFLQEVTSAGTRVLAVDHEGHASPFPILLTPLSALLADAGQGAAAILAPAETQLFADPTGSLAYATLDGHVGVVSPTTKHELGPLPCGSSSSTPIRIYGGQQSADWLGFSGLVPAGAGAFVVTCRLGGIALVRGDVAAE